MGSVIDGLFRGSALLLVSLSRGTRHQHKRMFQTGFFFLPCVCQRWQSLFSWSNKKIRHSLHFVNKQILHKTAEKSPQKWSFTVQLSSFKLQRVLRSSLLSEISPVWLLPAASSCPVFFLCICEYVCVSVCAIRGQRSASLAFMYAFDVKQSKYLRH